MRKQWCPQCGAEAWEVQGRTGSVLLDPANPNAAATDKVSVQFRSAEGITTSNHNWTIHRCKQIRFPKPHNIDALNAARRVVGLDPVQERGDSA